MSAHTPGPWSANLSRNGSRFDVCDSKGVLVCSMSWHHSSRQHYTLRDESEANAGLIAAAPTMLAALKAIAQFDKYEPVGPAAEAAKAAIKEAEGS